MLPVVLGLGGGGASFRPPMAIVVIGGLVTSTFLSLQQPDQPQPNDPTTIAKAL